MAMHAGVYAEGHPVLSDRGAWMAVVLAGGPGAVLSDRSAAALHGLLPPDPPLDVTVAGRSGRRRARLVLHGPRSLDPAEREVVDGIPVTTVARTLLDVAEVVPRERLERACDEVERLGFVQWDTVGIAGPARHA